MNPRIALVSIAAAILVLWGAWRLYSDWGLVSLDFQNAPIGDVLASIHRQGGLDIASNLPPETRVTIKLRRVQPLEALDTVAVRTDSIWRLAYLGAPDATAIDVALENFRAGRDDAGWLSHGVPSFGMVEARSGNPLDLRLAEWKPEGGGALHALLQSAAQATGVYLAAPSAWEPQVPAPRGGKMSVAAAEVFRRAGGVSREVFLLRGSRRAEGAGTAQGERRGLEAWIGSARPTGEASRRGFFDPEHAADRAEAQIKLLPPAEQKQARADLAMMRDFWQSVRGLPEEERRAKMREFFSRPEMQDRMEERRLSREAKMTPEQRLARSQNYWNRKAEAKYRGGGNP